MGDQLFCRSYLPGEVSLVHSGEKCLSARILSASENLRKATYYLRLVCSHVCLSIRAEHLVSHWTDFLEILYVSVFKKAA
jgi:hypothetical protein